MEKRETTVPTADTTANADTDPIVVLAPRGRDMRALSAVLAEYGDRVRACPNFEAFLDGLGNAACGLIAAQSLGTHECDRLAAWVRAQPSWSDFPFIVLNGASGPPTGVEALGNVTLLERPLRGDVLRRAITAALRARARQYQAREQMGRQGDIEEALHILNETLESRIGARTHDLARANDRLMKEVRARESTQSALVQSQKMESIGQLTGGLAHDFNNLLNIIMGSIELIDRSTDDARIRRLTGNARQAVLRGGRLTSQLLAFARSQTMNLRVTDVNALLSGMRDLLGLSLGATVTVVTHLDPSIPKAIADANQLELAVLNLGINARDAMPAGGTVTLTTSLRHGEGDLPEGDYVVIAVADTGCGIAPAVLSKVFDPFFTTKPVGKGTGLGLSQVYGIARQSGGTARINSELGKGTVVELWLSIAPGEAQAAGHQAAEKASGAAADSAGGDVLVIDDDPVVRNLIVECLQTLGYQVRQAADGESGLRLIAERTPDVLMVDFVMPGMNGAEVIERVRAELPDLPIILATGYVDAQLSATLLQRERILQKPFDIDELAATVRQALGRG
ncbi:response regulator [Achromobacter aloeverae]|uniref:histidine kinase n=1 Tax=Achromobacter aloeverae TaxID=1750518 RepID=A0A4V1MRY4_9BURK|nr:response regulator [Achromobacter aloeverae]RXN86928.1 hybrid sensor histidine kinase/response regulator [Achromobacter aloeverae]